MFSNTVFQELLAWVLTYALHSTVLLGLAWIVTRALSSEALRLKERVWKTALFGGIVSASLQAAFNLAPLAGRLEWTHPAPLSVSLPSVPQVLPASFLSSGAELEFTWERLIVGFWMLGGALGVALFLFAWRRITDRLAGREALRRGPTKEALDRLTKRAGLLRAPRLSISRQLKSPATVGVFFPQICVPARAIAELSVEQQEALLAHELAHILRRDPVWFFVIGLVERLFFFQVLNRIARRELAEIAEFLSDDWAAQNTRDELGLARCLTEVATWVLDRRPVVAVVPMAASNSRLAARIGRLLDKQRKPQDHRRSHRATIISGTALTLAALCLPGASAHSKPTPMPPVANPWSHGVLPPVVNAAPVVPRPQSTPQPRNANNMAGLLQRLDGELELLCSEIEQLHERSTTPGSQRFPLHTDVLVDLDQRVLRLRERQQRLRNLLPALSGQAQPTHPRNPKQEESK